MNYAMTNVTMTRRTAAALSNIGLRDFSEYETPERMAFVVLVLKEMEDRPERFPNGRWATIQHLEGQIQESVRAVAKQLEKDDSG